MLGCIFGGIFWLIWENLERTILLQLRLRRDARRGKVDDMDSFRNYAYVNIFAISETFSDYVHLYHHR